MPYCKLYDEGWKRIGCIACPMQSDGVRLDELRQYPGYEKQFRKSFRVLWEKGEAESRTWAGRWKSGDEMFDWWLSGQAEDDPDQGVMFE